MKNKKFSLTHARFDAAHCMTPGLFRSLKKGDRKRLKLDVVYECNGLRVEFKGPEPLGADDLRVLQGLVAMAGPIGKILGPEPKSDGGRQLRLALEPRWDGVFEDAIAVRGSYRALAREIGRANPDDTASIRECIERLWAVSIIAQKDGKRMGFRLLSAYASDDKGKLFVALNPLIARAVMGGQHARIELAEARALSDTALIIHLHLCWWIDPGKSGRVSMDVLSRYAWPDAVSGSAARMRRKKVRQVLAELQSIGWTIEEYADGKVEIKRPQAIESRRSQAIEKARRPRKPAKVPPR